ncbi:MAG: PQQ-binding-like beta-propeller repeat protein [Planctomycetes bacterium]|nr:PQQ-binding-like beta-propeller repeat protein [Planctomycetota bacterium]
MSGCSELRGSPASPRLRAPRFAGSPPAPYLLVAVLVLLSPLPAPAAPIPSAPAPAPAPAAAAARPRPAPFVRERPPSFVYFDEEEGIQYALLHLTKALEAGDARRAARILQGAIAAHGFKVAEAEGGVFLPSWQSLHRRLIALPEGVQRVHRELFAAEGRARLAAARAAGDRVEELHVCTAYLAVLPESDVLRTALRVFEEGRPGVVRALLEETARSLLSRRPSPTLIATLAMLYARSGDEDELARLRGAAPAEALAEVLLVGGRSCPLGEVLDRVKVAAQASPRACASELGGGTSPPPPCGVPAETPAWTLSLPEGARPSAAALTADAILNAAGARRIRALAAPDDAGEVGPLPATVAGELLLLNFGTCVSAFRLADGVAAWTRGPDPALPSPPARITRGPGMRPCALAAEVAGGRVFATLDGRPSPGRQRRPVGRFDLACLSLGEGKLLWSLDDANQGADLSFVGVPLPWGDRLYAAAVAAERAAQTFVVSVEAATGRVLWKTLVALRSSPASDDSGVPLLQVPVLVLDRGALYVCTSSGAFAALEPATGEFLWGLKYPSPPGQGGDARFWPPTGPRGPAMNPAFTGPEGLWLAPTDASRFFLVDPFLRALVVDHCKDEGERYRYLVGCESGRLILGGPELGLYSAREGLVRHWELSRGQGGWRPALGKEQGLGRGRVVVPLRREVVALDAETFARAWSLPVEAERSGDVLLAPGGLLLLSRTQITCYPWK